MTTTTYRIPGGDTGVLLLHGLGGTPTEMRYVAHGLARAGYTVHCPVLAGHGGCAAVLREATWKDWYASAEAALADLRTTCSHVVAGGLSTGSLLALQLAARNQDTVDGLALYAPTLWLNGWSIPWRARLFRAVFSRRLAGLFKFPDTFPHGIKDPRVRQMIADALGGGDTALAGVASTPGETVLEHHRLVRDLLPRLGEISQPTLIIHPREDDYAHLNNAFYLQDRLAGAVETTVLDDSYHVVTIDRQRQTVVERTAWFVAGLNSRSDHSGAKNGSVAPVIRMESAQPGVRGRPGPVPAAA